MTEETAITETKALEELERQFPYDKSLALSFIELLAQVGSLRAVCDIPWMPDGETVHAWIRYNKEFTELYGQALGGFANRCGLYYANASRSSRSKK